MHAMYEHMQGMLTQQELHTAGASPVERPIFQGKLIPRSISAQSPEHKCPYHDP